MRLPNRGVDTMRRDARTREEPGRTWPVAGGRPRAGVRHQRRPDPRAPHRHLRHRRAHPPLGRLGAAHDSGAARRGPRVRRRDRRRRRQRQRLPPRRPRQRRGPRGLRPLPQLHGRPPSAVRPHAGCRRQPRRRVRRADRPADDEHLAPLARHRPRDRRHLRPVRQRRPHRAGLPRSGRGRADHGRRPDRLHGRGGRAPRRRPARRRQRPQRLPPRSGGTAGSDDHDRPRQRSR